MSLVLLLWRSRVIIGSHPFNRILHNTCAFHFYQACFANLTVVSYNKLTSARRCCFSTQINLFSVKDIAKDTIGLYAASESHGTDSKYSSSIQKMVHPPMNYSVIDKFGVENSTARSVMVALPSYARTLFSLEGKHTPDQREQLIGDEIAGCDVSAYSRLIESLPPDACSNLDPLSLRQPHDNVKTETTLSCQLKDLSDKELLHLLATIAQRRVSRVHNVNRLTHAVADICCDRVSRMSVDHCLLMADTWLFIPCTSVYRVVATVVNNLLSRLHSVARHNNHLVQLLFYVNVLRNSQPLKQCQPGLERCVHAALQSLTINELAIVCMAFFKTRTCVLSGRLVADVCQRLDRDFRAADKFMFTSIVKMIRLSAKREHGGFILELCEHLGQAQCISSPHALVHLLLLATSTLVDHEPARQQLVSRLHDSLAVLRIKDMERLVMTLMFFDHRPGDVGRQMVGLLQQDQCEHDGEHRHQCVSRSDHVGKRVNLQGDGGSDRQRVLQKDPTQGDCQEPPDPWPSAVKTPCSLFDAISVELSCSHRQKELRRQVGSLTALLSYLAYFGYYPGDLLDILRRLVVEKPDALKSRVQVLITLHYTLQLQAPDIKPLLSHTHLVTALKLMHTLENTNSSHSTAVTREMARIDDALRRLVSRHNTGVSYTRMLRILPHFNTVVVMLCVDEASGRVLPLPDSLCHVSPHSISTMPLRAAAASIKLSAASVKSTDVADCGDQRRRWLAVLFGKQTWYTANTDRPSGHVRMLMRHLRLVGYTPVVIRWHEMFCDSLDKTLRCKLQQALGKQLVT